MYNYSGNKIEIDKVYLDEVRKILLLSDKELAKKQMVDLYNKKSIKIHEITSFYIKKNLYDSKRKESLFTINEMIDDDDKLSFFINCLKDSPFLCQHSLKDAVFAFLRLSGRITSLLPNYPIDSVISILKKYNTNNNYYDFSCGWGARLLGTLSLDINYFGTDPNSDLVNNLLKMSKDFIFYTGSKSKVNIYAVGSEFFIKSMVNKIGVAFSSPPYFDIEIYDVKNSKGQSINGRNYNKWLSDYMEITLFNASKYIIDGGYFLLNIKNTKKYPFYDDIKRIASKYFIFIENIYLKNNIRPNSSKKRQNNTLIEPIMVFKKN